MGIEELIKNAKKIFYIQETYDWGARHYNYFRVEEIKIPKGKKCLIITMRNYPFGKGSQWDISETLILVNENDFVPPIAKVETFEQDWSLLEKRPKGKLSEWEVEMKEITKGEALAIYHSYAVYPEDRVSIEIEEIEGKDE
jgi:hypothetical protein